MEEALISGRVPPTLVPLPTETRYMTVPWPGTLAEMEPLVLLTTCDQRLLSWYEEAEGSPAAVAEVEMVAAEEFSLKRTTETSPLARGLVRTCSPPELEISVPCLPSESWSTAMTSLLP